MGESSERMKFTSTKFSSNMRISKHDSPDINDTSSLVHLPAEKDELIHLDDATVCKVCGKTIKPFYGNLNICENCNLFSFIQDTKFNE